MAEQAATLSKGLNIIDVVAIGVGSAVGVSIFSIMAPAAKIAGSGMLVALLVASIPMIVFAVIYAYMGSIIPKAGASYAWPARFVHPFAGFMVAWLRILGNTGGIIIMSLVLVKYISKAYAVPQMPTMLAVITLFYLVNLFGVQIAARVERFLVVIKVIVFCIFVVAGVTAVQSIHFTPVLGKFGWEGVFSVLPVLISLYMGIESSTEVGEEIKDGKTAIARGITWAVSLSGIIYLTVSFVALGVLGAPALAGSDAPLLDAGSHFLGAFNKPLIICAAIASIFTSINGITMTSTRALYAMGRDGVLPTGLAKVHPRWKTPYVAATVVYVCSVLGLMLGTDLVFLFIAVNIPTMLKYFCNCWSAIRLCKNHPELHAQAKFPLKKGTVLFWGYVGMLIAAGIIVLGLKTDWRPYAVLGTWGMIGISYFLAVGRHVQPTLDAEAV